MSLETTLYVWGLCSLIVALGLAAYAFVLKFNNDRLPRWQRITMVLLGPITILMVILILLPPTRFILWALWDTLLKK